MRRRRRSEEEEGVRREGENGGKEGMQVEVQ